MGDVGGLALGFRLWSLELFTEKLAGNLHLKDGCMLGAFCGEPEIAKTLNLHSGLRRLGGLALGPGSLQVSSFKGVSPTHRLSLDLSLKLQRRNAEAKGKR